jgi:molecular chaperone DnaK
LRIHPVSTAAPVRIRLRYTELDTFVERFAVNVTRGGIFLASRSPRPVGEVFLFEVLLADGKVALAGEGKVTWVKQVDPAAPQKPYGMGVQFLRLPAASRQVLDRMLKVKAGGRVAPVTDSASQPIAAPPAGRAAARTPANGLGMAAAARAPVDTSVDLAAEYGLDETALRRATDRSWLGPSGRSVEAELEDLLKPEALEPATLALALAELPRLLDPAARRRTGAFRALEQPGGADKAAAHGGEASGNGTLNPKRDERGSPD